MDSPRDERHRDRGEASGHAPGSHDEQPGRRPLDRPLEAHEDGRRGAAERPRRQIPEIDHDQLEPAPLDEDIRRAPRRGEPAAAADPEEAAERDAEHRGRGRIETIRPVDERRPAAARRGARERAEEYPGAPGGPRADQLRELTLREAPVEERVERRETGGGPGPGGGADAWPDVVRGQDGVVRRHRPGAPGPRRLPSSEIHGQ